jgi:hypothetical protein
MLRPTRALVLCFVAGCVTPEYAVVGGHKVPRPTVGYSDGGTFQLEHRRAFPGVFEPSRGHDIDDGTLMGRVCGLDVRFDAMWYGSRLMLSGHGDVPWRKSFTQTEGLMSLTLDVIELAPGRRRIRGKIGGYVNLLSSPIIDLDVSADRLEGRVGMRTITLAAAGDYLAGRLQQHSDVPVPVDVPFVIYGRQMLGTMVPADEALVLVMMLTCNGPRMEYEGKMVRGFSLVTVPPKS